MLAELFARSVLFRSSIELSLAASPSQNAEAVFFISAHWLSSSSISTIASGSSIAMIARRPQYLRMTIFLWISALASAIALFALRTKSAAREMASLAARMRSLISAIVTSAAASAADGA